MAPAHMHVSSSAEVPDRLKPSTTTHPTAATLPRTPPAPQVSLALTAADLKGMTALVLNARPGVEAVLNASVTAKASAGFYKAVGDWVRKGNTLVLVNGAVGGFKPVIEKFM